MPAEAATYALPRRWRDEWGIRRYGFHGLSVRGRAEQVPAPRLVVCHLGGGCSVTAVRDGRSVDTTMGFTPLEGVPMATRSGSVDPGALCTCCAQPRRRGPRPRLEHESGLLGLAGRAGDVRELGRSDEPARGWRWTSSRTGSPRPSARWPPRSAASTRSSSRPGSARTHARVRASVCERLGFLGVELDPQANASARPDDTISASQGSVRVAVVEAREDLVAARAAHRLLDG